MSSTVAHYDETEYGAVANCLPDCDPEKKFYITTAISYTNGDPHIGHAYEFLTADVIARYYRILGYNTYFLTGTDEHGQKVAASAEKNGRHPQEHCDYYVEKFQYLHRKLLVTYSGFLRTTDHEHHLTCQRLWQKCSLSGDIYLDAYEGWYNEREETFVTQMEAEASGFKDPTSGLPLKKVTEESYFFRMSKFCEALLAHIESNPGFIEPETHRKTIISRLQKEGLKDLSISRTSFTWGIPVPPDFDQKHVMYVWFDALTNYLTGVQALNHEFSLISSTHNLKDQSDKTEDNVLQFQEKLDINDHDSKLAKSDIQVTKVDFESQNSEFSASSQFWPASMHLIGKDIIWFHCVIWPCMLMSANLKLPKSVFSHGFVNDFEGKKMSKSMGNVVDPLMILDKYSIDSLRYYCIASITYGSDLNFSDDALIQMHNSELADILGNLVNRVLNLTVKYCDGVVPDVSHSPLFSLPFDLAALKAGVETDIKEGCQLHVALGRAMEAARNTNKFLTESEPWKLKGDEHNLTRQSIVRTALEAIYAFAHFLVPVLPIATQSIFTNLNTTPKSVSLLRDDFYNLLPGTKVSTGEILFRKLEKQVVEESNPHAKAEASAATASTTAAAGGTKKAKQSGNSKPTSTAAATAATAATTEEIPHDIDFTKVDIRVGKITKIWRHETADRLYCEEIDVGEDKPRQICSGLRSYYSEEELLNKLVLVVCNLKETKLQGFMSYGMVLAAKKLKDANIAAAKAVVEEVGKPATTKKTVINDSDLIVELISPPAESIIGERVFLLGHEAIGRQANSAYPAAKMKKLKVWESVAPDLAVDEAMQACWKGQVMMTSAGPCFTKVVSSAPIS